MLEYLLQNGASIDAADLHGRAPLHYAAIFDRLDAAQRLLKHRATRQGLASAAQQATLRPACASLTCIPLGALVQPDPSQLAAVHPTPALHTGCSVRPRRGGHVPQKTACRTYSHRHELAGHQRGQARVNPQRAGVPRTRQAAQHSTWPCCAELGWACCPPWLKSLPARHARLSTIGPLPLTELQPLCSAHVWRHALLHGLQHRTADMSCRGSIHANGGVT